MKRREFDNENEIITKCFLIQENEDEDKIQCTNNNFNQSITNYRGSVRVVDNERQDTTQNNTLCTVFQHHN